MSSNEEFNLEVVRDFMISRDGRVTNHELVKHFKYYLTHAQNKELARNRFKQIVNTLANISTEGGEKYLVLKRRYRVGTPLSESEFLSSPHSPAGSFSTSQYSPFASPSQAFSPSSSVSGSPGIPPRYRAPPPYRPPPNPVVSPYNQYEDCNRSAYHNQQTNNPSEIDNLNGSYISNDYNQNRYDIPDDLGIPPPPQMERSSSTSMLNNVPLNQVINSNQSILHPPVRPKSLSLNSNGSFDDDRRHEDVSSSLSSLSTKSGRSQTPSYSPSVEEQPPPLPLRKKQDHFKENQRPSPEGQEIKNISTNEKVVGKDDELDEDRKKVSVKETTQKFNKMASVGDLTCGRASSKSNRNSRADRDDDDSSSIHSYGPDGQNWLVAAAKSDYPEILRLLKIHPTLARFKDLANGYTALHWASKHGRSEVVKLLAQSYQVDINSRTNGGYSPLHIAAIYNRQDVFDLLVHYGGDLNLRDYSGKKPRQYNTKSSMITIDPQKKQIQRRHSVKESGFLRIGSLNVKVRKTAPFNNRLSRDLESKLYHSWGSNDSLEGLDKDSKSMPPPKINQIKKKKIKKDIEIIHPKPTEEVASGISLNPDSDSDNACGFGSDWQ